MQQIEGDYSEKQLNELNRYEDTLDVFIHIMTLRLPTAYILINMTIIIWLVQSIFSSGSSGDIPGSLYFFAAVLDGAPLTAITIDSKCPQDYQPANLKTFPTVAGDSINRNNLTNWKQSSRFCVKKSQQPVVFGAECSSQIYCSGLCVDRKSQCPITSIRKVARSTSLQPEEQALHWDADPGYFYAISRKSGASFVVSIAAQYEAKCANDFAYFKFYDQFSNYWNQTSDCGNEGSLPSELFVPFDEDKVSNFFLENGIWSEKISKTVGESKVEVGFINRVSFMDNTAGCRQAEIEAKTIGTKLLQQSNKPQFSKNLLLIGFVLFTISWGWLIGFCCFCETRALEKNLVVILLAVIELIVTAFIYHQNDYLLETESTIANIAACISDKMTALESWNFNMPSRTPLLILMYVSVCFLLLQLACYFLDCFVYVPYWEHRELQDSRQLEEGLSQSRHF